MHTHKHAWNDGVAATAQGADADAGSFARLFRSTQLITFSTSNARTLLYVTEEHLIFVKWTLTYLTMDIV